jgi:hypothetical protein
MCTLNAVVTRRNVETDASYGPRDTRMFESQRAEPGVQENKPAFGQQSSPMDQDQDAFILAIFRMSS